MIKYEPDDILYYMVKEKYMIESYPTNFNQLLTNFRDKINKDILKSVLKKFDQFEYIQFWLKQELTIDAKKIRKGAMLRYPEFEAKNIDIEMFDIGIRNLSTLNELKKKFWFHRSLDWIKEVWNWLWKHFVVTVITSIVTAYLTIRFIG